MRIFFQISFKFGNEFIDNAEISPLNYNSSEKYVLMTLKRVGISVSNVYEILKISQFGKFSSHNNQVVCSIPGFGIQEVLFLTPIFLSETRPGNAFFGTPFPIPEAAWLRMWFGCAYF